MEVIKALEADSPATIDAKELAKDIRTYMALQGWASTEKALAELRGAKERLEMFAYDHDPEGRVIIYTGVDSPKLKKLLKQSKPFGASAPSSAKAAPTKEKSA
ncbi:MAG: hypothetical protein KGI38_12250 [Thaumarchaeota archaeon]|nr:hypothetical protein [Nitrososphaerota archaeon]